MTCCDKDRITTAIPFARQYHEGLGDPGCLPFAPGEECGRSQLRKLEERWR